MIHKSVMSNIYKIKGSDTLVAMLKEPKRGMAFVKIIKRDGKVMRGSVTRNIPMDDLVPIQRRKKQQGPVPQNQSHQFPQGTCPECGASPETYQNGIVPCPNCGHSQNENRSFKEWLVIEED